MLPIPNWAERCLRRVAHSTVDFGFVLLRRDEQPLDKGVDRERAWPEDEDDYRGEQKEKRGVGNERVRVIENVQQNLATCREIGDAKVDDERNGDQS